MHSTWSDGTESIESMARACLDRGYEYMAITDHSQAVTFVDQHLTLALRGRTRRGAHRRRAS